MLNREKDLALSVYIHPSSHQSTFNALRYYNPQSSKLDTEKAILDYISNQTAFFKSQSPERRMQSQRLLQHYLEAYFVSPSLVMDENNPFHRIIQIAAKAVLIEGSEDPSSSWRKAINAC